MSKRDGLTWRGAELKATIENATPDALFEAAQKIIKAAAAKAPSASGDLRESGYAATADKTTYANRAKTYRKAIVPKAGQAIAAFAVFYARFVELGTKRMRARPFLRPALDELRGELGADIAVNIGKKLK